MILWQPMCCVYSANSTSVDKHHDDCLTLAQGRVAECMRVVTEHMHFAFTLPQVQLSQRGKIAGSAHLHKNIIKLNKVLFQQNQQAFLQHVIPHEVAHIAVHQRYGKCRPHGHEWQYIMREIFALPAHVTHQFDVSDVARHVDYYCLCGTVGLSIIRHNKVRKGKQQYICKKCGECLKPALRESAV